MDINVSSTVHMSAAGYKYVLDMLEYVEGMATSFMDNYESNVAKYDGDADKLASLKRFKRGHERRIAKLKLIYSELNIPWPVKDED